MNLSINLKHAKTPKIVKPAPVGHFEYVNYQNLISLSHDIAKHCVKIW